jgi:hypothetical protein
MIKKIFRICGDPEHIIHKSQFYAGFFAMIVILVCSFLFPWIQSRFQIKFEKIKDQQESIRIFSAKITQTINYRDAMGEIECDFHNEKDQNKKQQLHVLLNNYYDKLVSVDPPYDTACTLLRVHFDKNFDGDISKFKKKMDEYIATKYSNIEDNECKKAQNFDTIQEETMAVYEALLNKLIESIE